MGGIFKFVLLLILAMVFFAPPQEANAFECQECVVDEKDPELGTTCQNGDPGLLKECAAGNEICISYSEVKDDRVTQRLCGKKDDPINVGIGIGFCKVVGGSNEKMKICICDTPGCNPSKNPINSDPDPAATTTISTNSGSIYLNGWPIFQILMFSFKIIIDYGFTQ